jgi:hypothetical protein
MRFAQTFIVETPPLDGFLQASIGNSGAGMPISVMSALAREGLDPQAEADRLTRLPAGQARFLLACLIAAVPDRNWPLHESNARAIRLMALLPPAAGVAAGDRVRQSRPTLAALARQAIGRFARGPGDVTPGGDRTL